MLESLFYNVMNRSITGIVLISVVMMVRLLLIKVPKKYVYFLWVIVAAGLVCPMKISSPVSIYNFFTVPQYSFMENESADNGIENAYNIQNKNQTENQVNQKTEVTEKSTSQKITNQQTESEENVSLQDDTQIIKDENTDSLKNVTSPEESANVKTYSKTIKIGSYIWLMGIFFLVLFNMVSLFKIRRKVAYAVKLRENIYECEAIPSPFVFGFLKSRIYLPFRLEEGQQQYIIDHEKYHIMRKDNVVKVLAFLLCIVYWFNPFVWLAYFVMIRDMEMSCDEYVLEHCDQDIREEYSKSLLGFATNTRVISAGILAFGESNTRRRVRHVMKFKKSGKRIGVLTVIITIMVGVCCLTDGYNLKANNNQSQKNISLKEGISTQKAMKKLTDSEKEYAVVAVEKTQNYEVAVVYYGKQEINKKPENGFFISDSESDKSNKKVFCLISSKSGELIDSMELSDDVFNTKKIAFPAKGIDLKIADYDGDGNKNDFVLGQGQTIPVELGNYMMYKFFGVDAYGKIILYHTSTADGNILTTPGEYSPSFSLKNGEIVYLGLGENGTHKTTTTINKVISPSSLKEGKKQQTQFRYGSVSFTLPGNITEAQKESMKNWSTEDLVFEDYEYKEALSGNGYVLHLRVASSEKKVKTGLTKIGKSQDTVGYQKKKKKMKAAVYQDKSGEKYIGWFCKEKGYSFLNLIPVNTENLTAGMSASKKIAESIRKN